MQTPIIVNNKEAFIQKGRLSDIELYGMKAYLDDYLEEQFGCKQDADEYYGMAYSGGLLNCCDEATLPGAPEGLEETPVSHFFLTENHCLIAVFYVGDEETEVFVRMN
ncbi:hypothetical protein D1872_90170 [compost metagenome]